MRDPPRQQAENGIDELGYLSAEGLLEEVLSWRLMIVPVLRTTGVNTKILVALELGVPLVITPVRPQSLVSPPKCQPGRGHDCVPIARDRLLRHD